MQFNDLSWQAVLASASGAVASGVLSAIMTRWGKWRAAQRRRRKRTPLRPRWREMPGGPGDSGPVA